MTYVMEQELIDYINAQRAEADEFSKQPGCWMGKMVDPNDTEYWSERAPCGTLEGFQRVELIEDAYYITADRTSKSYARTLDFANWSNKNLERHIERMCERESA